MLSVPVFLFIRYSAGLTSHGFQKGFPEDEDPTLQDRLEEFFNNYANTNAVRLRRDENKKVKVLHPPFFSSSCSNHFFFFSRAQSSLNSPNHQASTHSCSQTQNPNGMAKISSP